jgi:hypothetical protein
LDGSSRLPDGLQIAVDTAEAGSPATPQIIILRRIRIFIAVQHHLS